MQTDPNAKQQVVERIKTITNILVTVSRDPSVDELSAALALTLMLNKLDKHATAVFSGAVPPAIEFLEPGKTFENTTDSLRDFIIALDKEKADRLRYKVEEDVVRIFITPYKTTITDKDLQFSQGDFNVELIIALGVEKREDIDTAVTAHGRILHDATVVTINTKEEKSSVGSIDWSDSSASSLCEMLMSLSEALQSGILDQQMSTALLTGIVSATDRFRNEHTSPRVMTMAAQLMAAGANQQLIATKLEEVHELVDLHPPGLKDGTKNLGEGTSKKLPKEESTPKEKKSKDGEMTIDHKGPSESTKSVEPSEPPVSTEALQQDEDELKEAEDELAQQLTPPIPGPFGPIGGGPMAAPTLSVDDLKKDLEAASAEVSAAATEEPLNAIKGNGDWRERPVTAPSYGGTLNATTDETDENKRREEASTKSPGLLSHTVPASPPPHFDQPNSDDPEPTDQLVADIPPPPDSFSEPIKSEPESTLSYEPTPAPQVSGVQTLSQLEDQTHTSSLQGVDDARAAVDAALSAVPFSPVGQPLTSAGAQPLGDELRPAQFQQQPSASPAPVGIVPPAAPIPSAPPVAPTAPPPLPPLPDFSTLPPLPGEQPPHPAMTDPTLSQDAAIAPAFNDPTAFKIPGQPQ